MIVTFSGIDGSGKTTRCQALVLALRELGLPATPVKPSYLASETVKDFCEAQFQDRFGYFKNLDSNFYISCLSADWLAFLARTLKKSDGQILVCDRYIQDVFAQAIHMRAHANELRRWAKLFPIPELSFFLNVSPEVAHERLLSRPSPPIHEAEALVELRALSLAYDLVMKDFPWKPTVVSEETPTGNLVDIVAAAWTLEKQ